MKLKQLLLLIFIFSFALSAQNKSVLTIRSGGTTHKISYEKKGALIFLSSKKFAQAVNAGYYFNNKTGKAEIKFPKYSLTFTGWNQFVVLRKRKTNSWSVFQIPVSAKLQDKDILFPLQYSIQLLSLAAERKVIFNKKKKLLTLGKGIKIKDEKERKTTPSEIVNEHSPYDIYGISIEEKTNGTLIRLKSKRFVRNVRSNILGGKLIIFFPAGITINPKITKTINAPGFVKDVKVKNVGANSQIEFSLKQGYKSSEAFNDVDSPDLLITIQNENLNKLNEQISKVKKKWKLDTIVIDAGHGGKDNGTSGLYGTKEKNINLAIALKLGKLIEKNMQGVKVVYTRKSDRFVELDKRGQIANENHGDFFISIHCNATVAKPSKARGFEVYLLRPGKTKEAIRIAEYENSVINLENHPEKYKKLTEENFILVTMKNSSNMRYSEKFSDLLNTAWKSEVGIPSRGIKQAGFIVLIGASMPSVLIETGFLSNPKDARYLQSNRGQRKIAHAIFDAIRKYKVYYDKMFENIKE